MKPVAHYERLVYPLGIGNGAWLEHVDHPSPSVHGRGLVRTSDVVRIGEDGEFETRNTIYRKKEIV